MFKNAFTFFLVPATVATVLTGLIYATGQSIYRQLADDPQVQMAESAVSQLKAGQALDPQGFAFKVPINSSQSPYIVIYNADHEPVQGSGELNGTLPAPPAGVFDVARSAGENRITWQPANAPRQAVVIRYFSNDKENGYVLAGRSLTETENRVRSFSRTVLIAYLALMAILVAESLVFGKISHKKSR